MVYSKLKFRFVTRCSRPPEPFHRLRGREIHFEPLPLDPRQGGNEQSAYSGSDRSDHGGESRRTCRAKREDCQAERADCHRQTSSLRGLVGIERDGEYGKRFHRACRDWAKGIREKIRRIRHTLNIGPIKLVNVTCRQRRSFRISIDAMAVLGRLLVILLIVVVLSLQELFEVGDRKPLNDFRRL